jgi:uncharacterized protein YggE
MKRFLPLATICFTFAAAAQTAVSMPPREPAFFETVSVTGTGKATLVPDRYSFNVGVQSVAATVDEAVRDNNDRIAAVVAALKKNGATDAEVHTANFSITPQQDYSQGRMPRILGYQVNNTVTVTRKSVADAGKLLQAAINAGVNTSSGLQFEVSDPARGRDEGLRAAFADARAKAALLATAAGRTLGRALSITEGSAPERPPVVYARAMAGVAAAAQTPVTIEPGTEEQSYTVSVIFELR